MKKTCILITVLLLALLLAACGSKAQAAPAVSVAAPEDRPLVFGDFSTETLAGDAIDQSVFAASKLTMVNIWATTCNGCVKEMPELNALNGEYAEKGFAIVGVAADTTDKNGKIKDSTYGEAKDIVAQTGAAYPHIVPCKTMIEAKLKSCQTLPETVFVDSQGRQVGDAYFGAKSKAEWAAIADALLEAME